MKRTILIPGAVIAAAVAASGVWAATAAHAKPSSPEPSDVVASADGVAYTVRAGSSTISWPDVDARFQPLSRKATRGLVSAHDAVVTLGSGLPTVAKSLRPGSTVSATRYGYTNSSYGQIRSDGSVKLGYVNKPVWLITVPLADGSLDGSQGGPGSSRPKLHDCTYYYVVDAKANQLVTSGEECLHAGPAVAPTPPPAGK